MPEKVNLQTIKSRRLVLVKSPIYLERAIYLMALGFAPSAWLLQQYASSITAAFVCVQVILQPMRLLYLTPTTLRLVGNCALKLSVFPKATRTLAHFDQVVHIRKRILRLWRLLVPETTGDEDDSGDDHQNCRDAKSQRVATVLTDARER